MKGVRTALAGFVLGILVGAAGLNVAIGKHLDTAELEIRKLNAQLADQSEQLAALEKKLALKQNLTVNDIRAHVTFKDEFTRVELETMVKKLLKDVRGQEVSSLDPILVADIIDKRIVELSDHKYLLTVNGILVSERIVVYAEAEEITEIPLQSQNSVNHLNSSTYSP